MPNTTKFFLWAVLFILLGFAMGAGFSNYAQFGEGKLTFKTSTACVDTDGGGADQSYIKGTVSVGTTSRTDSCVGTNDDFLVEFFCAPDKPRGWSGSSAHCEEGYLCEDGACIEIEEPPANPCTDSDGGGTDQIYAQGTVSVNNVSRTDSCAGSGGNLQVEFSCNDTDPKGWSSTMATCPTGYQCSSGACVQ